MRLAVFSDVHGNLPALERVLADASAVDGYVCLGDTVNYGPWSNECVDVLSSLRNLIWLRGNHEDYFINGGYSGSNEMARRFFVCCVESFERLEELRNTIPGGLDIDGFHYSHTIGGEYIFPDTDIEIDRSWVIGHTHRQFFAWRMPFFICNTGSVGQNREFIDVAEYALVETEEHSIRMRQAFYNYSVVIKEMRARRYPAECVDYYERKRRYHSDL